MQEYNHHEYMRSLASRLQATKEVGHFLAASGVRGQDALFASVNTLRYPCLVADQDEAVSLIDRGSDNLLDRQLYEVYALSQIEAGDNGSVLRGMREARGIINQVVARLVIDAHRGLHGLRLLERDSIVVVHMGKMLGDACYGVGLAFSVLSSTEFRIDESQWV